MCGRFTLARQDKREMAELLGVDESELGDYRPRYNIAPMQRHFLVVSEYERRKALPARWGLVNRWAKDNRRAARCINAKSETVDIKPGFRDAFLKRRCVIPGDGFYEWTGPKNSRKPLWIHRADHQLLLFAGLHESWQREPGNWECTFTILTCEPNQTMAQIHNRMPVILSERDADDWMNPLEKDPSALKRLLVPAPDELLVVQPASALVNSPKNEGPELLEVQG